MDEAEILVEQDAGVRIITLNRPDRLNALVPSMMAAFADAVAEAARDPAAGCVVVTGAGRGFCSGGDLKGDRTPMTVDAERGSRVEQGFAELRGFVEASRLLHEMPKPTIAMVNGPVAGAGIGIAGACDLRFASETATFLTAFDRIGASGDFGSTWFWTRILGTAAARELFFLGEKIGAAEAHARGIYTKLFASADLRGLTMTAAQRLADGPRMAWRYMKANLNMAEDTNFEAVLDQECLNMGLSTAAAAAIHRATRMHD
ncbi:enoyl-CoA hydratase-related protein [Sphingomonas bacterium]|uniref:enoyl-CoA hydratase-related protein n=1 Tax=Sphingomonas bacterium TaxID=1895847 RepID=UPI0015772B1A|nr:enoyl-CoA hydratase-related protein [Sphingomonas bacterium]